MGNPWISLDFIRAIVKLWR